MRFLFPTALLFLVALSLHSWDKTNEIFIPPHYYVGDTVLHQFDLVLEEGETVAMAEELPRAEWVILENMEMARLGNVVKVSLWFTSFQTGTRTLPPLDLGGVLVDDIQIFTASLSEERDIREIRGIRDNLDYPGIKVILGILILLAVTAPYFLYMGLRIIYRHIHLFTKRIMRSGPRRRINRLRKGLTLRLDDIGRERDFFVDLSQGIRRYLSERLGRDYLSMTTRDMALTSPIRGHSYLWNNTMGLMKMADMVKFAGEKVGRKDMIWSLQILNELIAAIEEEEKHADLR